MEGGHKLFYQLTGYAFNNAVHIRIIDDNEGILVMLAILLLDKGHTVTAKRSFEDFETEIVALQPVLLLIDKNLGWADGQLLCRLIKNNPLTQSVPVIVFSAYPLFWKNAMHQAPVLFSKSQMASMYSWTVLACS